VTQMHCICILIADLLLIWVCEEGLGRRFFFVLSFVGTWKDCQVTVGVQVTQRRVRIQTERKGWLNPRPQPRDERVEIFKPNNSFLAFSDSFACLLARLPAYHQPASRHETSLPFPSSRSKPHRSKQFNLIPLHNYIISQNSHQSISISISRYSFEI
jgi:hypothetical protein